MKIKNTEKVRRCDSCQDILRSTMINTIKSIVHQGGVNYHRSVKISLSPTLTDSYATFIEKFRKTCSTYLRKYGHLLRSCLVKPLDLYNEFKCTQNKIQNQGTWFLSLPGTDSFINKSIAMYKDKSNNNFKNLLVVCLLKSFVANMSGEANPIYSTNIFNLYLALSDTLRKRFEFLSGNLLVPVIRKIQRRR